MTQQPAKLALGLQVDLTRPLQELEGVRPEVQAQDVPFPRQQVVADVQPLHRLQMGADDAIGDEGCHLGGLVAAVLDVVQRGAPDLQAFLVRLVPLGHLGVEIPAVVVEARRVGDGAHVGKALPLQLAEADDHVGDLHAGVVDVVLDLDRTSLEAQQPSEGIAGRRVAQMPDVRGLVGIDRRVLDDDLAAFFRLSRRLRRQADAPLLHPVGAIQEEIEIAVGRGVDARDALDRSERRRKLLGDGARRLAQAPGERKGDRHGDIPERAVRRRLERHLANGRIVGGQAEQTADGVGHTSANELMNGQNHSKLFRDTIFERFLRLNQPITASL